MEFRVQQRSDKSIQCGIGRVRAVPHIGHWVVRIRSIHMHPLRSLVLHALESHHAFPPIVNNGKKKGKEKRKKDGKKEIKKTTYVGVLSTGHNNLLFY